MTPEEFKEIVGLSEGLSSEMQAGFSSLEARLEARMDARFDSLEARFDRQEARHERHGALLQTGSRWVNRMNHWALTDRPHPGRTRSANPGA